MRHLQCISGSFFFSSLHLKSLVTPSFLAVGNSEVTTRSFQPLVTRSAAQRSSFSAIVVRSGRLVWPSTAGWIGLRSIESLGGRYENRLVSHLGRVSVLC